LKIAGVAAHIRFIGIKQLAQYGLRLSWSVIGREIVVRESHISHLNS
jgi:hypothetical protein